MLTDATPCTWRYHLNGGIFFSIFLSFLDPRSHYLRLSSSSSNVSSLLFSPDQECSPVITNITYFVRAFRGCCLYLVLFSIRQPKRPLPGGVVVGEAPLSHLHISHPMSTSCPDASQILPLNSRSSNRLGDDDDNEAREERETPRGWPSFYNIQSRGCFHRQLHYRNRCQKTPSLLVIAPPRGRRN